ncbi:MAG: hypothetical protein Q9221_000792 [Calogaya cf. arnoldii]
MIPVPVTSENLVYNGTEFTSNFDVAEFVTHFSRESPSSSMVVLDGNETVTETYQIAATFCSPLNRAGGHEHSVLLATHGFFYDGRYWDSQYIPSKYSILDYMTRKVYSMFFYDRLGTGQSQKSGFKPHLHPSNLPSRRQNTDSGSRVSGYVNQIAIETEILSVLLKLIRNGEYTSTIGKPDSVILLGHAFGSYIIQDLIASAPNIANGVVLTDISYDDPEIALEGLKARLEAYAPRIANTVRPAEFSNLDSGYLFFADIFSHVNAFFAAPDYEVEAVEYAQSIAQPFGVVEFMSRLASPAKPNNFPGPVLFAAGEYSFRACDGHCENTFRPSMAKELFLGTERLETYIHPGSGHALNFHTNATGLYGVIANFLEQNGF